MSAAGLSHAERNYYSILAEEEITCVGAGVGGGFSNTNELKVLTYKEAIASSEKEEWKNQLLRNITG